MDPANRAAMPLPPAKGLPKMPSGRRRCLPRDGAAARCSLLLGAWDRRPAAAAWAGGELHSFPAVGMRIDQPCLLLCIGRMAARLRALALGHTLSLRAPDEPLWMHLCFALRQVTQATGLRIADDGERKHWLGAVPCDAPSSVSPREAATLPASANDSVGADFHHRQFTRINHRNDIPTTYKCLMLVSIVCVSISNPAKITLVEECNHASYLHRGRDGALTACRRQPASEIRCILKGKNLHAPMPSHSMARQSDVLPVSRMVDEKLR